MLRRLKTLKDGCYFMAPTPYYVRSMQVDGVAVVRIGNFEPFILTGLYEPFPILVQSGIAIQVGGPDVLLAADLEQDFSEGVWD